MTFSFVDIEGRRHIRDREPGECPLCHVAVHADEGDWTLASSPEGRDRILEVVYRCPRRECGRFFIARYKRSDIDLPTKASAIGLSPGLREFVLYETVPANPPEPRIPQEVAVVSPQFPEIYAQALAAETFGLSQVAGVGYRKALEFLIKDYCISVFPDSAEAIKAAYLSTCIEKFVDSPEVKICAQRAAWIGNDETHYLRKWVDKDIKNLKELILLTVNWIHNRILTRKYADTMS